MIYIGLCWFTFFIETYINNNCLHKHIVYILYKCDLVPTWVIASYIKILSKDYPTIAFYASITNPLRQFDALHKDKKNISIEFIGYPNVVSNKYFKKAKIM